MRIVAQVAFVLPAAVAALGFWRGGSALLLLAVPVYVVCYAAVMFYLFFHAPREHADRVGEAIGRELARAEAERLASRGRMVV